MTNGPGHFPRTREGRFGPAGYDSTLRNGTACPPIYRACPPKEEFFFLAALPPPFCSTSCLLFSSVVRNKCFLIGVKCGRIAQTPRRRVSSSFLLARTQNASFECHVHSTGWLCLPMMRLKTCKHTLFCAHSSHRIAESTNHQPSRRRAFAKKTLMMSFRGASPRALVI